MYCICDKAEILFCMDRNDTKNITKPSLVHIYCIYDIVATLGKSLTPTCLEGSPVSSLKCDRWPWSNLERAVRPWSAPLVETDFASCATGR